MYNKDELTSFCNKKILITGANGMLGRAFMEIINLYIPSVTVFAFDKQKLNVTKKEKVLECIKLKPDYIIHCAALVNADYCEVNEEEAHEVFIGGMNNIINLAKITGSKVFYPQSFLIYDGKETPITETTIPKPLSIYGNLKLKSETMLLDELPESLVVRMAGFFGGRDIDKNFVGKIIPQMLKKINDGNTSMEIGDRVWQPTYTNDLAYNSLLLLSKNKKGTYCMASHGETSFYELSGLIIDTLGLRNKLKINKVSSHIVSKNEKAMRPQIAYIENVRLKKENLDRQRNWQESLVEYLSHQYFKNLLNE